MVATATRTVQQLDPRSAPTVDELASAEVAETAEGGAVTTKPKVKRAPDCAWCRYGKPAVAGAVVGGVLFHLLGWEASKGALYGVGVGLGYGQFGGGL